MIQRRLGRTGVAVGIIGLGTEHLIDKSDELLTSVIHTAIDQGINYLDFFYAQPLIRDQMGVALAGRREQVIVAGHLGAAVEPDGQYRLTRDPRECEMYFHDLLTRLRTDYIDVLMLHNCDTQQDYDIVFAELLPLAQRFQQEGKVRWLGFSGHTVQTSQQAVDRGAVDVLLFPIHAAEHGAAGRDALYRACVRQDVGLVAMKPFGGGRLLQPPTEQAVTPIACLSYALAQPGVSTVVPGVKNLGELADAVSYLRAGDEEKDFSGALQALSSGPHGGCVYCNHCLPCPTGIDIGAVSRLLDLVHAGAVDSARVAYATLTASAEDCIACGSCSERCPWGIDVVATMQQAVAAFH